MNSKELRRQTRTGVLIKELSSQAIKYRNRAKDSERALRLYTKEMHELKAEYETHMAEKDATIIKLTQDLKESNDRLEKML